MESIGVLATSCCEVRSATTAALNFTSSLAHKLTSIESTCLHEIFANHHSEKRFALKLTTNYAQHLLRKLSRNLERHVLDSIRGDWSGNNATYEAHTIGEFL